MEFSLKVVSWRKIIRLISTWKEGQITFTIEGEGEKGKEEKGKGVWLQVISDMVMILQIELDLSKLLTYVPPKDLTVFSLDVKTFLNLMKFADLEGIVKIKYKDGDGKIEFEFVLPDKSKSVTASVPESDPDVESFSMNQSYTNTVNILTKEFKQIIDKLAVFHDEIHIWFTPEKQVDFGVLNDDLWISVSLQEIPTKPSVLNLKCSSGKLITSKNVGHPKLQEYNVSKNYEIVVNATYLQQMLRAIDNLQCKPIYIQSKLFDERYPWCLEFAIPNVAIIKYFICLILEEKEE